MRIAFAARKLALIAVFCFGPQCLFPLTAQETSLGNEAEEGLDALSEERLDEAQAAFAAGLERTRRAGDQRSEGRFHFYLGLIEHLKAEREEQDAPSALDRAAVEYGLALELLPDDPDALNNLAQVYRRQGRRSDALVLFEKVVRTTSGDRKAVFAGNYGDALLEAGRWNDAVLVLFEALREAPSSAVLQEKLFGLLEEHASADLPRLLWLLVQQGESSTAERFAARALRRRELSGDTAADLLPPLAAALARQNRPPGELDASTAEALHGVFDLPEVGEGARQLLRLQERTIQPAQAYGWWNDEAVRSQTFRELVRSLAERSGASEDYERAEGLYRLAETLSPSGADFDPALDRAGLYAALGRDDDLAQLLAELDTRLAGPQAEGLTPQQALKAHTSLGVLFQGLAERRADSALFDRAISNLQQAVGLSGRYQDRTKAEEDFPPVDPASLLDELSRAYRKKGGPESEEQRLLMLLEKAEVYANRGGDESSRAANEILRQVEADPLGGMFRSVRQERSRLEEILHAGMGALRPEHYVPPQPSRPSVTAPLLGPSALWGYIRDEYGGPLPGATVTISGGPFENVAVSDPEGRYRLRGLDPMRYKVTVELEGFSTVNDLPLPEIGIGNYRQDFSLTPAAFEESITVTSETPLLQPEAEAKITVPRIELLASPRPPSVPLIPGLEPRELPLPRLPREGAKANERLTVAVNGVELPGATPANVEPRVLGGAGLSAGGASAVFFEPRLNLETRPAEMDLQGSAWAAYEPGWHTETGVDALDFGRAGSWNGFQAQAPSHVDRVVRSSEWGVDLGSSLGERFHLWGSYAFKERDLERLGGVPESTRSETKSVRGSAAIGSRNSLGVFLQRAQPEGTGIGAAPDRAAETTWNESSTIDVAKLEYSHLAFTGRLLIMALASQVEDDSSLAPLGGSSIHAIWDNDLVWRGSFLATHVQKKQEQQRIDLSLQPGESLRHELKMGLSFQIVEEKISSLWPGPDSVVKYQRFSLLEAYAPSVVGGRAEARGAYLQENLTRERVTLNVGARYDLQNGENFRSSVPANPLLPELLPAGEFAGAEAPFDWKLISPRLSLAYLLGEDASTVLKAGYGRYSDRLTPATLLVANPAAHRSVLLFPVGPHEAIIVGRYGVDPERPGLVPLGGLDDNLQPGITDEVTLGIEHRTPLDFVLGATLSFRYDHDLLELERLVYDSESRSGIGRPHRRSDYELFTTLTGQLPSGETYSVPVYRLRPGLTWLGGLLATNGDRKRESLRATVSLHRPLVERLMLRALFTWTDSRWQVPPEENEDPTNLLGSFDDDGAFVLQELPAVGPQPRDYSGSRWSFDVFTLYQIAPDRPWGFNAALLLTGREGGPVPYVGRVGPEETGDGILRYVQVTRQPDSFRTGDVFLLNGRLEKELKGDEWSVVLGVNALNLFDEREVLRRELLLGAPRGDYVEEFTLGRSFLAEIRVQLR